jgi:hypothetical protein
MPTIWFVLTSILRRLGVAHPMPFSNFVTLMAVFGALAIYNFATMTNRADKDQTP